jgi:hypothetical protein
MAYSIGRCPVCGAQAVIFKVFAVSDAKAAYAELMKRDNFWCVNTRAHPEVKAPRAIWHIMMFGRYDARPEK